MKISWFITMLDGSQFDFESEGTPPTVGSMVYVNDFRPHTGPGNRIVARVKAVDTSICLSRVPFHTLDLKERVFEKRFDEAVSALKERGLKMFSLHVDSASAECSEQEAQVHCVERDSDAAEEVNR